MLKCLLVSFVDSFELSGLQDLKISGNDIQFKDDLVPDYIYMRGLNLDLIYTVGIAEIVKKKIVNHIWIENATVTDKQDGLEGTYLVHQEII